MFALVLVFDEKFSKTSISTPLSGISRIFCNRLIYGCKWKMCANAAVRVDAGVHLDGGSLQSHEEYDVCQSLLRPLCCHRVHPLATDGATTTAAVDISQQTLVHGHRPRPIAIA